MRNRKQLGVEGKRGQPLCRSCPNPPRAHPAPTVGLPVPPAAILTRSAALLVAHKLIKVIQPSSAKPDPEHSELSLRLANLSKWKFQTLRGAPQAGAPYLGEETGSAEAPLCSRYSMARAGGLLSEPQTASVCNWCSFRQPGRQRG